MTSQDVHDFMDSHSVLSNSSRESQTDGQSVNYRVIRTWTEPIKGLLLYAAVEIFYTM